MRTSRQVPAAGPAKSAVQLLPWLDCKGLLGANRHDREKAQESSPTL